MSVFSPLNLVEGASKKDLEEEHTRETEYQNAFQLFQEAMKLKQAGDLSAAYFKFHELAQLDVIINHYVEEESLLKGLQNGLDATAQPDAVSYLHQNVKNIRFLYFRNRGFLYFAILKTNLDVRDLVEFENAREETIYTEDSFKKELFYDMLDGFSICPIYQEPDESLFRILDDLYAFLDMARLRRFNLEYAVSFRDESDDISSILPINEWAVSRLSAFQSNKPVSKSSSVTEKLAFLTPYKEDLQHQCMELLRRKTLNIDLEGEVTWPGVITAVNLAVKNHQNKEKGSESYRQNGTLSSAHLPQTTTQDVVMFTFGTAQKKTEKDQQNSPALEPAQESVLENVNMQAMEIIHESEPRTDDDVIEVDKVSSRSDVQAGLEKSSMRLSKRLNREDYQPMEVDGVLLTRRYFAETEAFFHNLNERFKIIFNVESLVLNDIVKRIIATDDKTLEPQYFLIFLQTLNEWKPKLFNHVLLAKVQGQDQKENLKDSDKKRLMDILTKFGNQISDVEVIDEQNDLREDSSSVKEFLQQINGSKKHINESKIEILRHLSSTIAEKSWEMDLFDTVFEWYMSLEAPILQQYSTLIFTPENTHNLEFLLSIYEVIINYYINCKDLFERSLESVSVARFKSMKGYYSLGSIEVLRVHYRITKWRSFLEGVFLDPVLRNHLKANNISVLVRFLWSTNYFIAADSYSWEEKRYVVAHLDELHSLINTQNATSLKITFPNYVNIGEFSTPSLHRRLSTASILSIFSKILDHSGAGGNNDTIFLLETILLESSESRDDTHEFVPELSLVDSILNGHALFDRESLSSVKTFFDECPLDLKLSLWSMLFSYYRSHSHEKYQTGFEQFLAFIINFLESSDFVTENANDPVLFIRLIASYTEYLDVFLKNLMEDKWILKGQCPNSQVIANLCRVFELCYSFSLHEESALITGSKVSLEFKSREAFHFFKNLCIKSITSLLVYCVNQIKMSDSVTEKDERIADLISVVHYQLGIRRLCDASEGLFLTFAEDNLMKLKKFPTTEITQLMSCRLHYKIKVDGKFPHDHYTSNSAALDKSNALELASFVLPLCFNENPLTQNFRNDLKQVVEDIYEIFGYPEIESDKAISENWSVLENFLDSVTLGPRFIKEVFHGLSPIEFLPPSKENQVARGGLYYLQAVLMFNSYKIRKKSAQSRTVELERIIALLKCDLVYGSKRAESWILLGQAYGFIVEDDTIWTSDKLNIPERKALTAISQKKALACYMMGIGAVTRESVTDLSKNKAVIAVLMNSFVKEMYSASRAPMDMIAFKVFKNPRFTQKDGNKSYNQLSETPAVSAKFCLTLMQRCLEIALKSDPSDWTTFYYLGKVRSKLSAKPEIVLETMARASELAKDAVSSNAPILEPAYKYYSLLYKFVKYDSISVPRGLQLLGEEPLLKMRIDATVLEKKHFYFQVAACLTKLSSLDKKLWYHKPSYRLATIAFDEMNDSAWARRAISRFFTLKSHNKTFLQMWKPENERPGKHFVYMYQYTQFFLRVLERDKDLTTLVLLFPKLRRANSSMVHLYPAWERLCSILCQLVREVARIESTLVERFLFMTSYATFIKHAKEIAEKLHTASVSPEAEMHLAFLYELMEMRKLNNGYGPTSLIDDTFSGVFIKIYNECVGKFGINSSEQHPNSPSGKTKRLAKKDLFPFAVEIAGKQKRAVEARLKQQADFFNEYVSQFLIEQVARSERNLFQSQRLWATYSTMQQLKASNRKMILSTVPGAHAPDFFLSKPQYVPPVVASIPPKLTTRLDGLNTPQVRQYYTVPWQQTAGRTQSLPMQNQQLSMQNQQLSMQNQQLSMQSQIAPNQGPYPYISVQSLQSQVFSTLPLQTTLPMDAQAASKAPAITAARTTTRASSTVSPPVAAKPTPRTTSVPPSNAPVVNNHSVTTNVSQPLSHNETPVQVPSTISQMPPSALPHGMNVSGEHPKCEICERNYALQNKLPYFKTDPKSIPATQAVVSGVNGTPSPHISPAKNLVRGPPVEDVFYDSQSFQNVNKAVTNFQSKKKATSVQTSSSQPEPAQETSKQPESAPTKSAQANSVSTQSIEPNSVSVNSVSVNSVSVNSVSVNSVSVNSVLPNSASVPTVEPNSDQSSVVPEKQKLIKESAAKKESAAASTPNNKSKPLTKRQSDSLRKSTLTQSVNDIIIVNDDTEESDSNSSEQPTRKRRKRGKAD